MSRYTITAGDPDVRILIGFDPPLQTFFAQIFDARVHDDAQALLRWLGTTPEAIPTVGALQTHLTGWATIPPDIVACLTREQQAATPPTALQRWALQILTGGNER